MKASIKYIYICLTLYFIYISAFIGQAILSHLRRLAKNLSVNFAE